MFVSDLVIQGAKISAASFSVRKVNFINLGEPSNNY